MSNEDILEIIDRELDEEIEKARAARRKQLADYEDEADEDNWIKCGNCSSTCFAEEIDKCHACGKLLCENCEGEHPYICGE